MKTINKQENKQIETGTCVNLFYVPKTEYKLLGKKFPTGKYDKENGWFVLEYKPSYETMFKIVWFLK